MSDVWEEYVREWGMVRRERKERKDRLEGQNPLHNTFSRGSYKEETTDWIFFWGGGGGKKGAKRK